MNKKSAINLSTTNLLIIFIVAIVLINSGIILYYNSALKKMQSDYNTKITELNNDIIGNINKLNQDLQEKISLINTNLSLKINLLDANLQNFRKQNEQEINTLNSLIVQIEKQSNIQLEELKQEVSNIQVKSEDFSSIVNDVLESVVSVGTDKGQGSGAIIDNDGFIATNYHVVKGASIIRVLTYDERVFDAQLIGFEENLDIAVLKINAGNLKSLKFDDSDDVKVGERVIALGNPAGLSFTVTEGIVSAIHRPGPNNLNIYTQTDVPINPGNSGGPLVNTRGRIIGINNFKIGGFESLGFAIESNTVKDVTDKIIEAYLKLQQ